MATRSSEFTVMLVGASGIRELRYRAVMSEIVRRRGSSMRGHPRTSTIEGQDLHVHWLHARLSKNVFVGEHNATSHVLA